MSIRLPCLKSLMFVEERKVKNILLCLTTTQNDIDLRHEKGIEERLLMAMWLFSTPDNIVSVGITTVNSIRVIRICSQSREKKRKSHRQVHIEIIVPSGIDSHYWVRSA